MLTALTLWLLYRRRDERPRLAPRAPGRQPASARTEQPTAPARPQREPAAPAEADDLTRIEGIGPATAARLQAAGISTFAQLARADQERLREIVRQVGLGIADPRSWPAQARLAARGDWEALQAFKEELKAGRNG